MAGSASAIVTNTENQKQCLQKVNATALHVSLPPANPSWAAVFGVAQLSPFQGVRPGAWLSPNHALPVARAEKHQESFSPCQPRGAAQDRGCGSEPMAVPCVPRSPEQGKAAAGPDSCIEPVSPPDGVGEAEHAKSAPYPVLFREGEPMDQRYGPGGDGPTHGLAQLSLLPKAVSHPKGCNCHSCSQGHINCWDRGRGWRC